MKVTWRFEKPSDKASLRLVVAFLQIRDEELRDVLVNLVERIVSQQVVLDELPPFPMNAIAQDNG